MKKVILIISMVIGVFMFSGCAGSLGETVIPPKQSKYGVSYKITKHEGDYLVLPDIKREGAEYREVLGIYYPDAKARYNRKAKIIDAQITMAAEATRKMGYNYFAVTNIDVSNLQGFPITNKKDLIRYVTLYDRKETFSVGKFGGDYRMLASGSEYFIRFMPISDEVANSGSIFVWKVSDNL